MLKASEIERVSMVLDNPLRDLEMQIMEDIVRRIKDKRRDNTFGGLADIQASRAWNEQA